MSKKSTATFQIISAVFMILSVFLSRYSGLMFFVSFFINSALISYIICQFPVLNTLCILLSSVVFFGVTSFINHTASLSDIFILGLLFVPGCVLGISFKTKQTFKDTFIIAMTVDFLILTVSVFVCKFVFEFDITSELRAVFLDNFSDNLSILKSLSPDIAVQLKNSEHQIFNTLYILVPGILPFAFSVIFVFAFLLQYAISKMVCMGYLVRCSHFQDGFDSFRPGIVTNIVLAFMIMTILFETSNNIVMICLNIALIILMLYFITTLSYIDFKFKQRGYYAGRRFGLIAAICVISVVSSLFLPIINMIYIFVFFGFLDSIFDFRKLNIKKVN